MDGKSARESTSKVEALVQRMLAESEPFSQTSAPQHVNTEVQPFCGAKVDSRTSLTNKISFAGALNSHDDETSLQNDGNFKR